jgi:hypothetical protein
MSASFTLSPTTGHSGGVLSITATGTSTSWTSGAIGTAFGVSGGSGASITGTSVNAGAQTATFSLNVGSVAGTLTITDTTDAATATVTVSTPSVTKALPPKIARDRDQLGVTVTGTSTNWSTATRFSCSGGTSSVLSQRIISATQAYLVINTGHGATTLTITNSTDDSSFTISVAKSYKHRRGGRPARKGAALDFPLANKR